MPLRPFAFAAGLAAFACVAGLSSTAHADPDGMLTPLSGGVLMGPGLEASTLGFGIGAFDHQRGFEFIGRAALGPDVTIGMGGPRGSFDFIDGDKVQFGLALAATFGGGRYRDRSTKLLAAAEPGVFIRFLTDKIGAIQLDAAWYQPVYIRAGGIRGGLLASIAWHPMFKD